MSKLAGTVSVPRVDSDADGNTEALVIAGGELSRVAAGDSDDSKVAESVPSNEGVTKLVVGVETVVMIGRFVVVTDTTEAEAEEGLKKLESLLASVSDISDGLESGMWSMVESLGRLGTYNVLVDTIITTLVDGLFAVVGPKNCDANLESLGETIPDVDSISALDTELETTGSVAAGSLVAVAETSIDVIAGLDNVGTAVALALREPGRIELRAATEVDLISMVVGKPFTGVVLDSSLRGILPV